MAKKATRAAPVVSAQEMAGYTTGRDTVKEARRVTGDTQNTGPTPKEYKTHDGDYTKPKDEPKAPLPTSLTSALPSAGKIVAHIAVIEALTRSLADEMEASKKGGAVALARAFVVLHRLHERTGRKEESKVGVALIGQLFALYKDKEVPEAFEIAGVPNVPLSEGYRVGVSSTKRASIIKGLQQKAKDWLREQGYDDIISETINASTLSAFAKTLAEEFNKDLPDDIFNVADIPTTSVTVIK